MESSATRQLECDGETFELRPDGSGGTQYAWLTGPNPRYGFSVYPASEDIGQHQANIRGFLARIDPETGYIEEG